MTQEETPTPEQAKTELPAKTPSKPEAPKVATAPKEDPSAALKAALAQIEQMKKDQADLEEAALERAAALAGIQVGDLISIEKAKKTAKELVECNIGSQVVHINGVPYSGTFTVPLEMAEVIMHAASAYRHQKMKESVGSQYQVSGGLNGPMTTRMLKQFAPGEE